MASNALFVTGDTVYLKSKNVKYRRNCNNCKKFYVGWGKYFCSKKCRLQPRGENSPSWKGDKVTFQTGRGRALKIYKRLPCQECGKEQSEIHHIDGNPVNNRIENIMFLCRKHHILIEKRHLKMLAGRLARRSP